MTAIKGINVTAEKSGKGGGHNCFRLERVEDQDEIEVNEPWASHKPFEALKGKHVHLNDISRPERVQFLLELVLEHPSAGPV